MMHINTAVLFVPVMISQLFVKYATRCDKLERLVTVRYSQWQKVF